jgi:hypothetical protein
MKRRFLTIQYDAAISDQMWESMVNEIMNDVEQIACDWAATAKNDTYELSYSQGVVYA